MNEIEKKHSRWEKHTPLFAGFIAVERVFVVYRSRDETELCQYTFELVTGMTDLDILTRKTHSLRTPEQLKEYDLSVPRQARETLELAGFIRTGGKY